MQESFFRSALVEKNRFQTTDEFVRWFEACKSTNQFKVTPIPFDKLDKWYFENNGNLVHDSGKFFKVEGIRVRTDFGGKEVSWDQPILNQPEIGILGIITKVFDGVRYFLMQAKMEPGNINILQLSPTVQATRSNFTRVHKGKTPAYLEYFLDGSSAKTIVDSLHTEQGTRFLGKRNRNVILEVNDDIELKEGFRWLTLGQIKKFAELPNFVNMDTRSVLSCAPLAGQDPEFKKGLTGFARDLHGSLTNQETSVAKISDLKAWYEEQRQKYKLEVEQTALNDVKDWKKDSAEIFHVDGKAFAVMAVSVEAGTREVVKWTQPLIRAAEPGITGFLTQKIDGVLHFLVQARLEPGALNKVELAPTVSCVQGKNSLYNSETTPFVEYFKEAGRAATRYKAWQSVEGGRFYQDQNEYIVSEVDSSQKLELPENYRWMTWGQLMEFFNIENSIHVETRELIASLGFMMGEK